MSVTLDSVVAEAAARESDGPTETTRAPPKYAQVLLPVWGYRFVRQFLEFSLPALLAPGNVPAVAEALPTRFILMTRAEDVPLFRDHPAYRQLEKICHTELQYIDELITDGNHTATITLAFARALRAAGGEMLDTCFFLLCSDFIFADGSLRSVVARLQAGASGVMTGNFQVLAEEAIPVLRNHSRGHANELVLPPRELMAWSLGHLHPATVANIVNFRLSHNNHSNRLFWRVDDSTLIGRFYLLHIIAVRPEVADFIVGASFDYSFVPETCPSGNVTAMTDSDEFLIVEIQPRDHESRHLRWGPIDPKALAISLSEWTTALHRKNVEYTLVFHAKEIPEQLSAVAAEAETFIRGVDNDLRPSPQPHRHHPYWIGSVASHRDSTRQVLSGEDWAFLLGEREPRSGLRGLLWRLQFRFFGRPPDVTSWHPRWPDYRLPLRALNSPSLKDERVLIVAENPKAYADWIARQGKNVFSLEIDHLLEMPVQRYRPLLGGFSVCMLFLRESDLENGSLILERIGPLLKPKGQVLILATNERRLDVDGFGLIFAGNAANFQKPHFSLVELCYISSSALRFQIQVLLTGVAARMRDRPRIFVPLGAAVVLGLALFSYILNRFAMRILSGPPTNGYCSSVFMRLALASDPSGLPLPKFRPVRLFAGHAPDTTSTRDMISAEQCVVDPDSRRESLGLRSKKIWHHDPQQFSAMTARYLFVANLLGDRHNVGEVGCCDAFGTRIVLQQARKVTVYDRSGIMIDDVQSRLNERWPIEAIVHDVMVKSLPYKHDSIFSLDLIDEIPPEQEHLFVKNLSDSLGQDYDILIIGSNAPSQRTPQPHGMHDESAAARYRRSGTALKAMLQYHFRTVFLFSMLDDMVIAGNFPTAEYYFALCCGKK